MTKHRIARLVLIAFGIATATPVALLTLTGTAQADSGYIGSSGIITTCDGAVPPSC